MVLLGVLKALPVALVVYWVGLGVTAGVSDPAPAAPATPRKYVVAGGMYASAPIACERHQATAIQPRQSRRPPRLEDGPGPASELVPELITISGLSETPRLGVDGAAGTLFVVSQA